VPLAQLLLIAYVFCGCVYWLYLALGALRVLHAVPRLSQVPTSEPATWPRLSLIVPAANEADAIESAARSILAQDYPNLELILVDDRSTDATGQIIDRLAAEDPRVVALHVRELPERWLGKVHALEQGVGRAEGDWLLLIDADVHLEPGTLRRAIAYSIQHELDHLAVVPGMRSSSFLVDAAVSMFLRTFPVATRAWAVARPDSNAFVGVGAFNLVRRTAFDRTEGFSWLRLEVVDDMGLAWMLKRHAARVCLADGSDLLWLYWYRSLDEMARGTEKAFAAVADARLGLILGFCLIIVLLELAPLAALLPLGVMRLWPAGAAMLAALVLMIGLGKRRAGRPLLPGLLWPIGLVLNVGFLLRSAWLGWRRGGIVWRDTFYPTPMLREGKRVHLLWNPSCGACKSRPD
jgi:glycosyltransferase involved in cell wall biosynthesis